MQLLASAEQMQRFDREAIGSYRIPGLVLMENAGRGFVDLLEESVGSLDGKSVLVMSGKGNNGGDGFVIGRHCANRGASVTVVLLGRRSEVRGDARINLEPILRMAKGSHVSMKFHEVRAVAGLRRLSGSDIIIDAIFGTGFSGDVRGLQADAISWINRQRTFVASVDIPSGVDASTGIVAHLAVRASLTVTMGLAKVGQFVGSGPDVSGAVRIADIGVPRFLYRADRRQVFRVQAEDVKGVLPLRARTAHKYSAGKVFVLAGSRSFTGAPYMTAQSALKAGSGAVILGIPRSIQPILAKKVTEVILVPLDETQQGTVAPSAVAAIREKCSWADAVAIGPGMSRDSETDKLIREIVAATERPMVIDADALNALEGAASVLRKRKWPTIVTPHSGELSRLIGIPTSAIDRDRVASAREASRLLRCVVVLKGAPTVTANLSGQAFVNSTGNPGMATIGSGDVLTGVVASLLSQGAEAPAAAWSGVFLHGRAGDIGAQRLGQRSLLALDILEAFPASLQSVVFAP